MLGSPEKDQIIPVLVVRRLAPKQRFNVPEYQWLVCTGMSMGRWTLHFGIHCCADDMDNKEFAINIAKDIESAEIFEFQLHCNYIPSLI